MFVSLNTLQIGCAGKSRKSSYCPASRQEHIYCYIILLFFLLRLVLFNLCKFFVLRINWLQLNNHLFYIFSVRLTTYWNTEITKGANNSGANYKYKCFENYYQLIKGCWQCVLTSLPTSGPLSSSTCRNVQRLLEDMLIYVTQCLTQGSVQGISGADRVLGSIWILRSDVRRVA